MKCMSPLEKARLIHLTDKNLDKQSAAIDRRYRKLVTGAGKSNYEDRIIYTNNR